MVSLALSLVVFQTPQNLLRHVRLAMSVSGAAPWNETRLSGSAEYYGVHDDYSLVFKPSGQFVQTFKGPIGETFGYDGKTFWQIDRSRGVEKLDLEDRDRQLALSLVMTSAWLSKQAPVKISQIDDTLHLKFATSGQEETLRIDRKTWLPVEASFPVSSGKLIVKLGDWKAAGDRMIPMHVEVSDGGLTDTIAIEKVESGDALTSYKTPDWKPTDMVFNATKPALVESKHAISGHVLVHPMVNGKDVGWFILDSGAEVMVIDKHTADDLKLESVGHLPLTGVGGTVESAFRPVEDFTLGPATLQRILFTELDLSPIGQFLGIKLAGIVGDDFLRRSIVSMDLTGPVVEVHSRDSYTLPAGTWLPLRFSSGNPAVEATIHGAPKAWYRFDTGANGTLTLHAPFVTKWKLLDGKTTSTAASGGVGGMVISRAGRIKWFELGGHRFENPVVQFASGSKGAFAESYLAGNIGQDFMRPFRIVLDFTGHRIALLPR